MDREQFIRESNAIENVRSEPAFKDSVRAWNYLIKQDELTHEVVKGVHFRILQNRQPDIAGEYRDVKVWVGDYEAPEPEKVPSLMDDLLAKPRPTSLEDIISYHIEFEKIHPHQDGNGRVGRMIVMWHCEQAGVPLPEWYASEKYEEYYPLFNQGNSKS